MGGREEGRGVEVMRGVGLGGMVFGFGLMGFYCYGIGCRKTMLGTLACFVEVDVDCLAFRRSSAPLPFPRDSVEPKAREDAIRWRV